MNLLDDRVFDPPLRAVRAFEVTARLGSMAAAASELAISPSAISHQLALLETFLNVKLLRRDGRGIQLTEEGRHYYRSVRSAFAVLREATEDVREGAPSVEIKLSSIPLFATGWLIPNLHDFVRQYPAIKLSVNYANHQNYKSDPADISVRFGKGKFNGYIATMVLSGNSVPVCSTAFLKEHGPFDAPSSLLGQPLIHDEDRSGWTSWFEMCGVSSPARRAGDVVFEDGQLAAAAAMSGLGVALLRKPLIKDKIQSGALVELFDHQLNDDRHYYLCHRADAQLSEYEVLFMNWLKGRILSPSVN